MRLDKPIGIFLLLWPTLIALWLASDGNPNPQTTSIFVIGVILMRSAGCVINDYADRDFDLHVQRTMNRPIAAGKIGPKISLSIFVLLLLLSVLLVSRLNIFTIALSCIAAGLAIIYPFSKRVTNYPQFILGAAFAWAIPMVYAQIQGQLTKETLILFASIMVWVIAYDTQYAIADKDEDLKIGVKSTAIAFGVYDKIIIFLLQMFCLLGLGSIGVVRGFSFPFYLGLLCAVGLAIYQQWLIKDRLPQRCMAAFLNNNYFGMVIFIGLILN
jgi:4-hydroxybenzoate polyprenyltransferase